MSRRRGYALLTGMVVLAVICLAVVWQYHYYAEQWLIEDQLTRQFLHEAAHNLSNEK
ncbi:hypothetical protein QUW44_01925 [Limosilactobacillus pontis]|uniref:Two-component sensor histidine kinase n=2 Tax=Limosilactobacillus TaxID=2742598 RepID=A0ABT7UW93_9LACO|nr:MULTISPECIES: hypothetical protein [Limosilactobacillus]MDM8265929.1 hypothetical protein [Limosilactobacillus pontis]MDM8331275.1 hypothetical protein [Limosilactobacillus pontis]HIW70504.1 hypothetical protein [Candidatus Limosilactobacillus merdipullorum]HJA74372.1 hypothetical protein [Candidatus Limosilactobacillus gallistercoris]